MRSASMGNYKWKDQILMSAVYIRSMFLFDDDGTTIAEFMLMEDATDPNAGWVKVIPTWSAYEIYKIDPSNVIVNSLMPGMQMLRDSFLAYLGHCANYGSKLPYPWVISSFNGENDVRLILTTGLSIGKVQELTGWDLEYITEFYKDYVVFG